MKKDISMKALWGNMTLVQKFMDQVTQAKARRGIHTTNAIYYVFAENFDYYKGTALMKAQIHDLAQIYDAVYSAGPAKVV